MGIRFIYGRAGTGKSMYCINDIKNRLKKNESNKLIYIVPEQYTFQRETLLLKEATERALMRTQVISFKRMAYRVFEECSGRAHDRLKDSGKNMLLYKVIQESDESLEYFNKIAKEQGFIDILSKTITEFKKYNITSELINKTLEELGENSVSDIELKQKMHDLSYIYDKFNSSIFNNSIDSDDELTILKQKLEKCTIYDDAIVWFDEFTTFTPQQLEVIRVLAKKCKEINITLCMDEIEKSKNDITDVFDVINKTEQMILNMMKEENIEYLKSIDLNGNTNNRFKNSSELSHLEKYFYAYPFEQYKDEVKNIRLYKANNIYDEMEAVAKEIIRLVQKEEYRYKDISVVCRNIESYDKIAAAIFTEYNIPYFLDKKIDLLNNPVVVLILSSLEIYLKKWSYESVFKYLKSDLTNVTRDEIDILENFVLANGIKNYKWTGSLSYIDEKDQEIIDIMEKVRTPLMKLHDSINNKPDVRNICKCIYEFLVELDVFNKIDVKINEFEENALEDKVKEYSQIVKIVLDILDQAVSAIGDEKTEIYEFYKILNSGFEGQEIGVIPISLDQVNIGDIARIKGRDVKALFIIGVNDGVLPSASRDEGILSDKDRDILKLNGITLSSTTKAKVFEEQFMVYTALTLSSRFLMISYPMADFEGKSLRPSIVIPKIKKIFPKLEEESSIYNLREKNDEYFKITAPLPTFNELILAIRRDCENKEIEEYWDEVFKWFKESEQFKNKSGHILDGFTYNNTSNNISREIVKKLYSNNNEKLLFSISRLERYAECPFAYFIQYGLKAKDRKIYEFSAPDLGSFMHDILDDFTKYVKYKNILWSSLDKNKCKEIVNTLVNDKLKNSSNSILNSNKRYKYFTTRFKRVITKSVSIITEQMKKGQFEIYSNEFTFGNYKESSPIKLSLPTGEEVYLTGRIDRIDKLDLDGNTYIRIVDYKTGMKEFNLNELYYGLQIQLLVYLDAILRNSQAIFEKQVMPGAILYFRIDDPIIKSTVQLDEEEINKEVMKKLKMNGLLLKDVKIVQSMDNDMITYSLIIPATLKKDGTFSQTSSVVTEEQFDLLREYVNEKMVELCTDMLSGKIKIEPCKSIKGSHCEYCDYSAICQFDTSIKNNKYKIIANRKDKEVWEKIKEDVEGGENL